MESGYIIIVANLPPKNSGQEATPTRPHRLLGDNMFVPNCILKQDMPGWKIIQVMRRLSLRSKEKLLFDQYVYIYIYNYIYIYIRMCNVCIDYLY